MVTILVTKHQENELNGLFGDEWWERLADITEYSVEYLKTLKQPMFFRRSSQADSGTIVEE